MVSALVRFLAIAAMILMPIGMGTVAAAPATSHASMQGQEDGHCGQGREDQADKSMAMQCSGTCTAFAAEPAALPLPKPALVASLSVRPDKVLHGVKTSLATPPPRMG